MPDCQKDTNVPYCAYVVNFSHDNTTTKMPNPKKPKPARVFHFDLHGNAKKKETAPDGGKDENVFDIMQGVSINIFVKKIEPHRHNRTQ